MPWTVTAPGLHERCLGDIENSMVTLVATDGSTSREPILIFTVADFSGLYDTDTAITALRNGWKALRLLKSPDIATTFRQGKKYYAVPSTHQLETWLKETFTVLPNDTSIHDAIANMRLHPDSIPFCYLLPQTSSQPGIFRGKLILFISHWRSEARGCFKLVNQIFDYAADLLDGTSTQQALNRYVLGNEVSLLTQSLEEIAMGNRVTTPAAQARVDADFANFYANHPSVDFTTISDFSTPPSHMKLHQRMYTPKSTSLLVKACKDNSLSVTAAIHAMYIGAVWQQAPFNEKNRPYACMMPAEMRDRLPASSGVRDQGAWCPAQQLLLTVPPGQDFFTRARHLRSQYERANQPEWLYEDMRAISEGRVKFFANGPATPSALPWFSALGVLDTKTISSVKGKFQIERLAVWCDFLSPGVTLITWTFQSMLNFQFAWNTAYHDDRQISQVVKFMEEAIDLELGIKLAIHEARDIDC